MGSELETPDQAAPAPCREPNWQQFDDAVVDASAVVAVDALPDDGGTRIGLAGGQSLRVDAYASDVCASLGIPYVPPPTPGD